MHNYNLRFREEVDGICARFLSRKREESHGSNYSDVDTHVAALDSVLELSDPFATRGED